MSFTYALNTANDMVISNGKLVLVTGADEVRQRIKTTLLHDYQEYFLNTPAGTPWYEVILGSKDLPTVSAILRQIVLNVPGVLSIISFNIGLSNRTVTISIRVEVQGINDTDIIDIVSNLSHPISLLDLNQNFTYIIGNNNYLQSEINSNYIVE